MNEVATTMKTLKPNHPVALCDGLFEVEDRGDGVAEIALVGHFGTITEETVEHLRRFDEQLGRRHIGMPIGHKISGMLVGLVQRSAHDDGPVFPGTARFCDKDPQTVANLLDLEAYLELHRDRALKLLLERSEVTAISQ